MSKKNIANFKQMYYICFDIYPDHRKDCHPLPIAHEVREHNIFSGGCGRLHYLKLKIVLL